MILLTGGTHTGKTHWAQRWMEEYHIPFFSIDHLKMGLIRSGVCPLTPDSPDEDLTAALWPIVREMVKTCIENGQNLIVEGCYIPLNCLADFPPSYQAEIRCLCLIFSERYLREHLSDILKKEMVAEQRLVRGDFSQRELLLENRHNLEQCQALGFPFFLIDGEYPNWLDLPR